MKILLSAIACTPDSGSEGAVGWDAATAIAKRHEVHVITDSRSEPQWRAATDAGKVPPSLTVSFVGEWSGWHSNRMIARLQSWKRYLAFNRGVAGLARKLHHERGFDLVHQVTYATWRVPSPLWNVGLPFVWGPLGGAGHIPPEFRGMLDLKARCFESLRDIQTIKAKRSRAFLTCLRRAAAVIAANSETRDFLQPFRGDRPMYELPVAFLSPEKVIRFTERPHPSPTHQGPATPNRPLRIFAGGNMEGRKGVSLALEALSIAKRNGLSFHYTIAGGGPAIHDLRQLATELGIADEVEFHPGYSGAAYIAKLQESDVYLLPSFRETMGITMQEAMLAGAVAVVADTSAGGEIAKAMGGLAVPCESTSALVQGLADELMKLGNDLAKCHEMGAACSRMVTDSFAERVYMNTLEEIYRCAITRGKDGSLGNE